MLCVYPPEGNRDQYPNHDEVKYFIQKNELIPLRHRIAKNRAHNFRRYQLVTNLYQAVADLQLLRSEDILDWAKLQRRFQSPNPRRSNTSRKLLSEATRSCLPSKRILLPTKLRRKSIRDLNGILKDAGFYESTVFSALAVSGDVGACCTRQTEPH